MNKVMVIMIVKVVVLIMVMVLVTARRDVLGRVKMNVIMALVAEVALLVDMERGCRCDLSHNILQQGVTVTL